MKGSRDGVARVGRVPGQVTTTGGLRTRAFTTLGKSVEGFELLGDAPESKAIQRAIEGLDRALLGQYFQCVGLTATGEQQADFSGVRQRAGAGGCTCTAGSSGEANRHCARGPLESVCACSRPNRLILLARAR